MGVILGMSLFMVFSALGMSQSDADALATNLLTQSGRHCAMIAVPHCGSGELAQSFWNYGGDARMIVDAFESDPTSLAMAQQKANALKLLGRNLYVRAGSMSTNSYSMPYADHYCDLLAITSLTDTDLNNISYAEIERVISTGAKAWIGRAAVEGAGLSASTLTNWINAAVARTYSSAIVVSDATGTWAVITKINRLQNTYEGKSGAANSGSWFYNDKVATWPSLPQWFVKPYGCDMSDGDKHDYVSGDTFRSTFVGGGRVYGFTSGGLSALRANNGQLLWQRSDVRNGQPFSQGVYSSGSVIDGETGTTISHVAGAPSGLMENDVLYTGGSAYDFSTPTNVVTLYQNMPFAGRGTVIAGGKLYSYSGSSVYCYDASNGSLVWGPMSAPASCYAIRASTNGVLVVMNYSSTAQDLCFLSTSDGTKLWGPQTIATVSGEPADIAQSDNFNYGREFVCAFTAGASALDLLTGQNVAGNKRVMWSGRSSCGRGSLTPAGSFGQANGMQYSFSQGDIAVQSSPYINTHSSAPLAASGMTIYENKGCDCYGTFMGERAEGAMPQITALNPEKMAVESERLEKGPVYNHVTARVVPDTLDWPTHRANNSRSGYTPAKIAPDQCVQLWKYTSPTPNVYKSSDPLFIYHDITPPVTAGGYTYLAGSDGIVKCIENASGSNVWNYATGGWIFATPTIANGCVYVGSGDGYAYCIEAHTGKLVWRFRGAPAERRFNYYGHQISAWPILTGVLVHTNGLAYFVSGLWDIYGVQAYALDARTGSLTNGWQNAGAGVYRDNRPGLARVGHCPGGYMTVVGANLWVKEPARPNWGSAQEQGMGVFDLQTGAISTNNTRIPRLIGSDTGRQIAAMGNYVIGWGEDFHSEMQYKGRGSGWVTFMQIDSSGNPVQPFSYLKSYLTEIGGSDLNCLAWDDTDVYLHHLKYNRDTFKQWFDNAIGSSTLQPGLPASLSGQWQPNSVGGMNRATALTANCLVEVNSAGDIGIMDRVSGRQLFHVSAGGEPYLQALAVDRSGKIIVANRNGDVVCYGTTNTVIVVQPTNVSGINPGKPATFSVEAAGVIAGGPLSYQWYHNGQIIMGATNAIYAMSATSANDPGDYYVIVTNGNGSSVQSTTAALAFTVTATITSPSLASGTMFGEPANILISANACSLHGTITGLEIWQGTNRFGSTTATNFSMVWTNAAAGNYSLTARAYDSLGATGVSSAVNITVAKLTVHLPFDDGGGTMATNTAGIVNGTLVYSPTWEKQSLFNGGIHIATNALASSAVTLCPVNALTNSAFTVAFWIKSDFGAWTRNQWAIWGKYDATGTKDAWLSSFGGSTPFVRFYTTTGLTNNSLNHSPASNTWYHYAIAATPSEVNWYINGVLFSKLTPLSGTFFCSYTNFVIGNWVNQNNGFQGVIDELQIFDNALSANAILGLVNNVPFRVPPTISIASPANNTVITSTNSVTMTVNTTVSNCMLTVIYYQNGIVIGTNTVSPYSLTWSNVTHGTYNLTAVAVDGLGQAVTSSPVTVQFVSVTPPSVSMASGTYASTQTVMISCADPNAQIYYTTDGRDPTPLNGILISSGSSITINGTMVLRLRTFEIGMFPSEVQSAVYCIVGRVAAGQYHSTVLKSDGSLWNWGYNLTGQLGDGTGGDNSDSSGETTQRKVPVLACGMTNVVAIADGYTHSLAVKSDGTVWAWGIDWDGELGNGKVIGGVTGDRQHNTIWNKYPHPVGGLSHVISVAAGQYHSLALKSDGTVWAWGGGGSGYNYGQLGDGSTQERDMPVQVGASVGFGNVVAIAGGTQHSLAVKSDGTVWAYGYNNHGQLGNGNTTTTNLPVQVTGLSGVMAIAGGAQHSLALKSDGTVWAWGNNSFGQLGDGSTIQRTAPVQVSGLNGVVAIASGDSHSLALKNDGTVWAWGYNVYGQLGIGTSEYASHSTPIQVVGGDVTAITAGQRHSLALKSDGSVWAWGYNNNGQLGNGTITQSTLPTAIAPSSTIVSFTLAAESVMENAGAAAITAQLWTPVGQDVIVPFTVSGTAVNPTDYTIAPSSPLVIKAGQISTNITVNLVNDNKFELDRTVIVAMGTPTNATLGGIITNTLTINNDDPMPTLSFTVASQSVVENAGTATIRACLSQISGNIAVMNFNVSGTAVNPTDFTIAGNYPNLVYISAGTTNADIILNLTNRAGYQGARTVIITINPPPVYAIAGAITTHTLTISDKEVSITTPPADQTVNWGQPATFTVIAAGVAPISYQWRRGGVNISGATIASYTTPINGVSDNGATFDVIASNVVNCATSSVAHLAVFCNQPPSVSIISPKDGTILTPPMDLLMRALPYSGGAIAKVEFFNNGTRKIGEATLDPFTLTLYSAGSGTYNLTAVVTDNQGQTATSSVVQVTVTGTYQPALSIVTASLPTGVVGMAYNQGLTACGGTPGYTWSIISNGLPVGLGLVPGSGAITGTPAIAVTTSFTARVTDAAGSNACRVFSISAQSAYNYWCIQSLGTTNVAVGGPLETPAHDGIANLMKYALGLDPLTPGYQNHFSCGVTNQSGQSLFALTYTCPYPAPMGITYAFDAADDVRANTWTNTTITVHTNINGDGTATITVHDNAVGNLNRFMRLLVTGSP